MNGWVAVCEIELWIPAAESLKEKRQVVRSVVERIRQRCGASAAETDFQDVWQRAGIVVAVVSGRRDDLDQRINHIRRILDQTGAAEVREFSVDWI
ncbi:MAG TPA: DUF503 domain-containing protein [Patescibacteria group bacterium]|nr:DUF503 domain-containing protein [Patescibacteria group bacterium]